MKRLLTVLGILIILVVAAIFILPIVFKDEIMARAKSEINNNLTAKVDFEDINISLFRSFPDFSLTIENTTVDGTGIFDGVRLADIEDFTVNLGLFSVISGNQFEVDRIWVKNAKIHVIIDTSGAANYDITKPGESDSDTADSSESSDFKFTLKSYGFENVDIIYDDQEGDIYSDIKGLTHTGSGDFTADIVNLTTKTNIEKLTVRYEGINYLDHVAADMDADIVFDQVNYKFTFGDNELSLNQLPLNFTGWVAMPADVVDMDLAFDAPSSDFKHLLTLIPAVYLEEFEDVKTTGEFAFSGTATGTYDYEDVYPAFDVKLNVKDGSFQYPDLPASVSDIAIDSRIYNESSDLDGMVINVPKATANVGGSLITSRLNLSKTMSNPTFDMYLKANMDLANIARVVPADGYNYSGKITADLDLAGNMADIEAENYEKVKAIGSLVVQNMVLKSDSLPYPVEISSMNMVFSPQNVTLNNFDSKLGHSDLSVKGTIDNILSYVLEDKSLKADFTLTSSLMDLNELSGGSESAPAEENSSPEESSSAMEVVRIPQNLDVNLTTRIDQLIYDNLTIDNLNGKLALLEGKASLQNLVMELLNGNMALSGSYDSKPELPLVDMDFKINNFGIRESYDKLQTIQKLAPIMQASTGTYSTSFNFSSVLNQDMTPDYNSIQAAGSLSTRNLQTSPKALKKLSATLQNPTLETLSLGNVDVNFKVDEGRVTVEPFKLKAGNVSSDVYGSMGLDQSLDYTMDMKIPVNSIKAAALLNQIGAAQGSNMDLKVLIGGTATDPKVKTSLEDLAKGVVDNLKDQAKQKVEETVQQAKDDVNKKAQELIDEAEKKGDALIAEAQKQADAIMAEANKQAKAIRDEAEKQATALEDEAKGNILKEKGAAVAAKKIRDEADDKANKLVAEAQKKADGLVDSARKQKEQLVQEAREKGQVQ